jgi:uncharacterized protein YndB with AHSA1/START domain
VSAQVASQEGAADMMTLGTAPSTDVGMLIRRPPEDVFEALADPSITTRFWYTRSTGRMAEGAELTWTWEMYGVSTSVRVREVEPGRRIGYTWDSYDPAHPTTVQFQFIPYRDDTTYLRITETGFTGDGDTQVRCALDSTAGFTFLLGSLKAALEHDITLRVVLDAHPPDLPRPAR